MPPPPTPHASCAWSPQELHTKHWPAAGIIPRALKNLFERLPPKFARVAAASPRAVAHRLTPAPSQPHFAAQHAASCTPPALHSLHRQGRALEPSWLVKLSVSGTEGCVYCVVLLVLAGALSSDGLFLPMVRGWLCVAVAWQMGQAET